MDLTDLLSKPIRVLEKQINLEVFSQKLTSRETLALEMRDRIAITNLGGKRFKLHN